MVTLESEIETKNYCFSGRVVSSSVRIVADIVCERNQVLAGEVDVRIPEPRRTFGRERIAQANVPELDIRTILKRKRSWMG